MMRCVACKRGSLSPGVTAVTIDREHTTIVFRHVPADVCDDCGEAYLSSETAQALERAADKALALGVRFEVREFAAA